MGGAAFVVGWVVAVVQSRGCRSVFCFRANGGFMAFTALNTAKRIGAIPYMATRLAV